MPYTLNVVRKNKEYNRELSCAFGAKYIVKNSPLGCLYMPAGIIRINVMEDSFMKKVVVFFALAMLVLGSCSNKQKIVGSWTDIEGYIWVFSSDGKLTYDTYEYQYDVTKNKLTFENEDGYGLQIYDISMSSDGKTLILSGGKNFRGWRVAGPGWSENRLIKK